MAECINLSSPTFEHHHSGLGVSTSTPRVSWRFQHAASHQNWKQTAYEIQLLLKDDTHASAYRESADSVLIPWPFEPLQSRQSVQIRVRVFGTSYKQAASAPSPWSPWGTVETAFLEITCWKANFITTPSATNTTDRPFRIRKGFRLPKEYGTIIKARLYSTALGVYQPYLNGSVVGDHVMAPGWTSYHHRLHYQIFDVISFIRRDLPNVLAFEVAEGWYAGRLGWGGGKSRHYGDVLAVLAQLEVQFDSGETYTVFTDADWACKASPLLKSQIYDGEIYDAAKDEPGWSTPVVTEMNKDGWAPTKIVEAPLARLISPDAPPVRITAEVAPVNIFTTPSGKRIIDFGQNLVGKLRLNEIIGPSGHSVSFIHAEVIDNGELGVRPLRQARCTDEIILSGQEIKDWMPKFTFHGFRYVQVDGWDLSAGVKPDLNLDSVTALVVHSDMTRTGTFHCSHPLVNKIHENVVWSMRGNFFSIPTDCPQRDERLGWTGDVQIFAPTANFLYNSGSLLASWLQDLAAEQAPRGGIPPLTVPNILDYACPNMPQAVWGDAAVLTPWDVYVASGDLEVLRRQYASMKAWIDEGIRRGHDDLWDDTWQLGDWLDPTAPPDEPGNSRTHGVIVADAYLVHITSRMAEISALVGDTIDEKRYQEQTQRLKTAFSHKYIAPSGLLVSDTQTALSLAICFGFYNNQTQLEAAGARLEQLVRLAKFRVATGFAGTPIVLHALTMTGREQVAYRMLQEKRCPSWLYPITMGATTVWERWDSMLPDGSINPGEMTSFNHFSLGAVANWLHSVVGGIRLKEPGWRVFFVAPRPGGTLRDAKVTFESPYGRIECSWSLEPLKDCDHFEVAIMVPPNSEAWVKLPDKPLSSVEGYTVVGSGSHTFSCTLQRKEWPLKAMKSWLYEEDDGDVA
ncbi:hypothetical protein N0V90_005023 [Kalmusia sp. IMI 367209]|nr:hypothetical protein N0V90_005023 [Kalmusia sp. IMI 367209]